MTHEAWQFISFTVRMALLSMLVIVPPGLALAWCLARHQWRGKVVVETLTFLPLVLPPVVTGLILLQLFGRHGVIGHWLYLHGGMDVAFTWRAVVLALAVMSFPLFVRAVQSAFEEIDPLYEQIARTLGASEWRIFFTILLPLARRGILAGLLLAFARALGEFGATIIVAGNIPGQTTTLSVAIYQAVQLGQDSYAWILAGVSAVLACAAVWLSTGLLRHPKRAL